jgi:hypothetical protein
MENNLPVSTQHIDWQISVSVGCKVRAIANKCIPYLFLPLCAVNTIVDIAAVIVWVNITG